MRLVLVTPATSGGYAASAQVERNGVGVMRPGRPEGGGTQTIRTRRAFLRKRTMRLGALHAPGEEQRGSRVSGGRVQ